MERGWQEAGVTLYQVSTGWTGGDGEGRLGLKLHDLANRQDLTKDGVRPRGYVWQVDQETGTGRNRK